LTDLQIFKIPQIEVFHVLEMFRRTLPKDTARLRLNRLSNRLSNRLTKILIEARNLATP
jgi:hypothetical protein